MQNNKPTDVMYNNMSDVEIIQSINNDPAATHRERVMAGRLGHAHQYVAHSEYALLQQNLLEGWVTFQ